MKKKLGQEPAFTYHITMVNGDKVESVGISKRLYIATEAMNLPSELINVEFTDEDMVEDENGSYIKDKSGKYIMPISHQKIGKYYLQVPSTNGKKTYSISPESTPEKRLARWFFNFADEMLKQENYYDI